MIRGLNSVRGRLWAALGLLSVAVLSVSAVSWIALQRVDAGLQDLHRETLSQVAQALDLSKRSSDLATSAPYLLNQRSNFLIEQEGAKLVDVLDRVRTDWPQAQFSDNANDGPAVSPILDSMTAAVTDLVRPLVRWMRCRRVFVIGRPIWVCYAPRPLLQLRRTIVMIAHA